MSLSLPARSDPQAPSPDRVRPRSEPHKEEVEIPTDITVSLRGFQDPASKGQISALVVTTTAGSETLQGTQEERTKLLREKLTSARTEDSKGGKRAPTVRLEGERDLCWSAVVAVMDVCSRAGFQVSFARPTDLGGR
jgi:hypothetical protein